MPTDTLPITDNFRRTSVPQDSLTITDNRTGQNYTLSVENGTIRAMDLRKIKTGPEDFGLMTYDPAFMNTASCRSAITFIDGDRGILRYRGYPIDVLAATLHLSRSCLPAAERRTSQRK